MDWNQDTANIIYASNDGYAGHLAASLYSLMDHNRNIRNMDIYVLSVGMCREYRERLSGIPGIRLCEENPRIKYNYAYMPVVFDGYGADRDQIFEALKEHNIFARKYFYPCVNSYQCYREQFQAEDTPVAARIASQVLTLPLYADMPVEVADEICDVILAQGNGRNE